MKKELVFLRTFAIAISLFVTFVALQGFKKSGNEKFAEIDVERINIVEKDGTVKMVITNVDRFPNGEDKINNRELNVDRKKRSGMLFFNEEGIECGGFIYDGKKLKNGHSSGLSFTFDQYNGDQVLQLLTTDYQQGNKRMVGRGISFNDQPVNQDQSRIREIMKELNELKDPKVRDQKYREYKEKGLVGGVPRMILGNTNEKKNGLFLYDDNGRIRASFSIDKDNQAILNFLDEKGNIVSSFPEKK